MEIDTEDFKKALAMWYWVLDEYNNTYDKEFQEILNKYNLTKKDIGVEI